MRGWGHFLLMTSAAALCALPLLALGQAPSGGGPRPDTGEAAASLTVDSARLQGGQRASRVIGATVYGLENEAIGTVEDLIFTPAGGPPVAILSVGGFLGIGARLVAIPYERLQYNAERERWTLPGATRDSLRTLPGYSHEEDGLRRRG